MHTHRFCFRLAVVAVLAAAVPALVGVVPAAAGRPAPPVCPAPTTAPVPLGPEGVVPFEAPTFAWRPVPGAESYLLVVFAEDGTEPLARLSVPGKTQVTVADLPQWENLRWKVRGQCRDAAGPYSASLAFNLQPTKASPCVPIERPEVFGPRGLTADLRPTFSWGAATGAESYSLVVQTDDHDPTVILQVAGIQGTAFTPEQSLPDRVPLRWSVRGEADGCPPGPRSEIIRFEVVGPETSLPCRKRPAPTPFAPQGTLLTNRPLFRWSAVSGLDSYVVEARRRFDNVLVWSHSTTGTTATPEEKLPVGIGLAWSVRGLSRCGVRESKPMTFLIELPE